MPRRRWRTRNVMRNDSLDLVIWRLANLDDFATIRVVFQFLLRLFKIQFNWTSHLVSIILRPGAQLLHSVPISLISVRARHFCQFRKVGQNPSRIQHPSIRLLSAPTNRNFRYWNTLNGRYLFRIKHYVIIWFWYYLLRRYFLFCLLIRRIIKYRTT